MRLGVDRRRRQFCRAALRWSSYDPSTMPEYPDVTIYIEALERHVLGAKLLADRALSRLLKKDWPRTLEELEEKKG